MEKVQQRVSLKVQKLLPKIVQSWTELIIYEFDHEPLLILAQAGEIVDAL